MKIFDWFKDVFVDVENKVPEEQGCQPCSSPVLSRILSVGDEVYTPMFGPSVVAGTMSPGTLVIKQKDAENWVRVSNDGRLVNSEGAPVVFPSEEAYKKNPFDFERAWFDWLCEVYPRCAYGDEYFYISTYGDVAEDTDRHDRFTDKAYNSGNYFRRKEDAEQVAKEFRKILRKRKKKGLN